jgi:hypothetical protein
LEEYLASRYENSEISSDSEDNSSIHNENDGFWSIFLSNPESSLFWTDDELSASPSDDSESSLQLDDFFDFELDELGENFIFEDNFQNSISDGVEIDNSDIFHEIADGIVDDIFLNNELEDDSDEQEEIDDVSSFDEDFNIDSDDFVVI